MAMVYHEIVYMVLHKLLTVSESMITKAFATKLATIKTDAQMDQLADEIIEKQLPSIKKNWDIPNLENMEVEVLHLSTYWAEVKRVSIMIPNSNAVAKILIKFCLG